MMGVRNAAVRKVVSSNCGKLPDIQDCSATARRYRDIFMAAVEDQGGVDRLSEALLQLLRRFAAGSVLAEQMEARLMRGDEIDITAHALLASTLLRISHCIGIDRPAKNTTSSLRDYLAAKATSTKVTE